MNNSLAKYLIHVILIVFLLLSLIASAESGSLKALAQVGDKMISQTDLEREINGRVEFATISKKGIESLPSKLISATVDRLIDRQLLLDYGEKKSLLDEKKVSATLERFVDKMGGEDKAESKMRDIGVEWKSWKSNISDDIRLMLISEALSHQIPEPNKQEIKDYLSTHPQAVYNPDRIKFSVIVIKDNNPLWEQEKISTFAKGLRDNPSSFAESAREFSDGTSAKQGGSQGYIIKGSFDKKIEDMLYNMKDGEISKPILFNGQKYIFKIEERKGGDSDVASKEHLAAESLKIQKGKDNLSKLLNRLKSKIKIEKFLTATSK